jgi:hypothetical protein
VAVVKTKAQLLTTLAGLLVPTSIRAWLRDMMVAFTPAFAAVEKSATQTITAVGQTPITIPFLGGATFSRGDGFIINLPAGIISRTKPGYLQIGAQVTVELPTGTDCVVQLFKGAVATVSRTQIGTDNKALTSTFILNTLAGDEVSGADYTLRIFREVGTSDLVIPRATFFAVTL